MSKEGADTGITIAGAFKVWDGARWVLRKVPYGKAFLRAVRSRRDADQFRRLHTGVFHSMRQLAVAMSRPDWDKDAIVGFANDMCTSFNNEMITRFQYGQHDMHCCWKTLSPPPEPVLTTFAKSRPFDDGRPKREPHPYNVGSSTICAALSGGDDGITRWGKFPCFCSNNLPKHFALFKTGRDQWNQFYQSALVFPLRYVRNTETDDQDQIGFLAFNSQKLNAFPDMPEIFDHRDRLTEYRNKLDRSPTYHLGAIFAENLSAYLHGVYNARLKEPDDGRPIARIAEQGADTVGADDRDHSAGR